METTSSKAPNCFPHFLLRENEKRNCSPVMLGSAWDEKVMADLLSSHHSSSEKKKRAKCEVFLVCLARYRVAVPHGGVKCYCPFTRSRIESRQFI